MALAGVLPIHGTASAVGVSKHAKNKAPMHYYLQCCEKGGVFVATNRPAFHSFPMNPNWMAPWLQSGKFELPKAREQYVRCCRNLRSKLGNLEDLTTEREQALMVEKKNVVTEALASELRGFKTLSCQAAFLAQFDSILGRYKIPGLGMAFEDGEDMVGAASVWKPCRHPRGELCVLP